MPEGELAAIAAWMPRQRWYAGKDHAPVLRVLDDRELDAATGMRDLLLMDEGGSVPVLYQVPVVTGSGEHGIPNSSLEDAAHDPRFVRTILALMSPESAARFTGSTVLSGEQSNTSVVISLDGEPALIAKIFRTLHHGDNPDVTLQSALSAAGSLSVPRFLGRIGATWDDAGRAEGVAHGDLVFAQEFVAGSRDGWGLALAAATRGDSFADDAHALGVVTADVHETLARVLPVEPVDVDAVARSWRERLALASAAVTALDVWGDRIRAVYERALSAVWPAAQRVHGDLHLGQALHSPQRGWVLVDFEGEPLRPMAERDRPDSAIRDIAGMLRSFAYAQGAATDAQAGWADAASAAYLEGYQSRSGVDLGAVAPILDAFELDKAVYEALYEARNRPAWLPIPIRGIERVLARVDATA